LPSDDTEGIRRLVEGASETIQFPLDAAGHAGEHEGQELGEREPTVPHEGGRAKPNLGE
jgi:hypothetical protein